MFDDARQDAWDRRGLSSCLRLFFLDDFGGLNRNWHEQAPRREVMELTWNAGLLDLDRKRLGVPLHFFADYKRGKLVT